MRTSKSLNRARGEHDEDQDWMRWKPTPPLYPGWYWVACEGVWPQCVEYTYIRGKLQAIDRHTAGTLARKFWVMCAGPIPDPPTPKFLNRRDD